MDMNEDEVGDLTHNLSSMAIDPLEVDKPEGGMGNILDEINNPQAASMPSPAHISQQLLGQSATPDKVPSTTSLPATAMPPQPRAKHPKPKFANPVVLVDCATNPPTSTLQAAMPTSLAPLPSQPPPKEATATTKVNTLPTNIASEIAKLQSLTASLGDAQQRAAMPSALLQSLAALAALGSGFTLTQPPASNPGTDDTPCSDESELSSPKSTSESNPPIANQGPNPSSTQPQAQGGPKTQRNAKTVAKAKDTLPGADNGVPESTGAKTAQAIRAAKGGEPSTTLMKKTGTHGKGKAIAVTANNEDQVASLSLPEPKVSSYSFHLDTEDVEDIGHEGAINRMLENTLGLRVNGLTLRERGSGIIGVVKVLEEGMLRCPKSVILEKWLDDLLTLSQSAGAIVKPVTNKESTMSFTRMKESTSEKRIGITKADLQWTDPRYIDMDEETFDHSKGGAIPDPYVVAATVPCYHADDTEQVSKLVRCIASRKCNTTYVWPRKCKHLLGHISHCSFLPPSLRTLSDSSLSSSAPVAKVADLDASKKRLLDTGITHHSTSSPAKKTCLPSGALVSTQASTSSLAKSVSHDPTISGWARTAGKKELKARLDNRVTNVLCENALPPQVFDSIGWKELFLEASPLYETACASTIRDTQIPETAAYIQGKQLEYLRTQSSLTISFDGGSNCRNLSFYTVHITTMDRRVFLLCADYTPRKFHNAQYICDLLKPVRKSVSHPLGIKQDSEVTGNDSEDSTHEGTEANEAADDAWLDDTETDSDLEGLSHNCKTFDVSDVVNLSFYKFQDLLSPSPVLPPVQDTSEVEAILPRKEAPMVKFVFSLK
ncbi:hypothetical protein FRC11_005450 [Ceratobasidium sp. 423]|nr:hypothetical protein FRC11_005450 [Ceratobasidium sp. 423]